MKIIDVSECGARPGAENLQTSAIQQALDSCAASGGGEVRFPAGIYNSGTLQLYSNLTLRLDPGAVLRAPETLSGYRKIPFAWEFYHSPFPREFHGHTTPFLYAENATNIRICGGGEIDLNGYGFAEWQTPCSGTKQDVPPELEADMPRAVPGYDGRPSHLIFFSRCREIEIDGVTFRNSPNWTIVFHRGERLHLHDLTIQNHPQMPNSDGIHCCGCCDVEIEHCRISGGDDCIALTGLSDPAAITESIRISDCEFRSSSAALRIGFQDGKIRGVQVKNCIIADSNRGVAVFAGAGGWVRDVSLEDLRIETRIHAGCWWGKGEPLVVCSADEAAEIADLVLRRAKIQSENGIVLSGVSGSVRRIRLEDVDVELRYGRSRPFYGGEIDLAPNPSRPGVDAERAIPWLWSCGTAGVECVNTNCRRAAGEKRRFDVSSRIGSE